MYKDESINANRWNSNKYDKYINILWPILISTFILHLYCIYIAHISSLFFCFSLLPFQIFASFFYPFFTLTLCCTSYWSSFKKPFYPRTVPINKLLPLYKRSWRSKKRCKVPMNKIYDTSRSWESHSQSFVSRIPALKFIYL